MAVGLAFATLFSACQKEQDVSRLELTVEGMGGEKMYVDGLASYWQTGDAVNINGEETNITVNGNLAYVENIPSAENYYIVFPASDYRGRDGSVVTVDMPSTYQYRTGHSGDYVWHQLLDAPMAYYGDAAGGQARMMHLTGALNVQITGPSGIVIDRIIIGTTQNRVMSGTMQFDLSDMEHIGSSATNATANNTVEMIVGMNVSTVQIPIPVLAGNLNFVVKVEGHVEGTKYIFERTQNTGGHLGRGVLGNVTVNLNEGQTGVTTSALFPTTTIGTKTYYEISTPSDLQLMSAAVYGTEYRSEGDDYVRKWIYNGLRYCDANYLVVNDIDMSDKNFTSITGFGGEFNGGNHTIRNLKVGSVHTNNSWYTLGFQSYWGVFTATTCTDGASVKVCDVTFENLTTMWRSGGPYEEAYDNRVGALFSVSNYDGTTIDNVHITNFRVVKTSGNLWGRGYIGGFIGQLGGDITIRNSSITFAANQDFCSGDGYTKAVGGIYGYHLDSPPTCTLDNVSVDFGTMNFTGSAGSAYYFGGLGGAYARSGSGYYYASFNGTCSGVVVTGNVTYNNGLFGKVTPTISELDGINANGLTITQNTK